MHAQARDVTSTTIDPLCEPGRMAEQWSKRGAKSNYAELARCGARILRNLTFGGGKVAVTELGGCQLVGRSGQLWGERGGGIRGCATQLCRSQIACFARHPVESALVADRQVAAEAAHEAV